MLERYQYEQYKSQNAQIRQNTEDNVEMDVSKPSINNEIQQQQENNMQCSEEQQNINVNLENEMNSRNLSRIDEEFNRNGSRHNKPRKSLVDIFNDIKNPQHNQTYQNTINLPSDLQLNSAYRQAVNDSNEQLINRIQTNVNNQNIISNQLEILKNINSLNGNNSNVTVADPSNNNDNSAALLTAINQLTPTLSDHLQNNPNEFNSLGIAGLINQAKENELAIRYQSLQRAILAEKNLNKIQLAKDILDQTRNQFQHQQHQQQQQQQQQQHHHQQVIELQQQSQQANSIDAAPPTPERINANQFHLQNLQNLQNQNSSSTLASHNTNNVTKNNTHVIYNHHPQSHVTNTCNVTSLNYNSSSPIVQHNNNNNNSNNATNSVNNSQNPQHHTAQQHSNKTLNNNNTSNNTTPPKNNNHPSHNASTSNTNHGSSSARKNSNNNSSPYQRMSLETRLQMAEKLNSPANSIQDSIEDVKKVFVEFNHFIKMMRWTIAFIANEFDYSPTRMGEILKFQNIKNGKRKIPEWIKLSRKMLKIMNDNIVKQEYEQFFQNFQANKQNRNQNSSRTANNINSSSQNVANGIQSNINTGSLMMNPNSLPSFPKNNNSQENNSDTRFIGQEPGEQHQQHQHHQQQQRKFN